MSRVHFMVQSHNLWFSYCGGYLFTNRSPVGGAVTCKRCIAKMFRQYKESA